MERLARSCVLAAIEAAGPEPYDDRGRCLLPTAPHEADLAVLSGVLGHEPSFDESRAFVAAWKQAMAEMAPDREDRSALARAWRWASAWKRHVEQTGEAGATSSARCAEAYLQARIRAASELVTAATVEDDADRRREQLRKAAGVLQGLADDVHAVLGELERGEGPGRVR